MYWVLSKKHIFDVISLHGTLNGDHKGVFPWRAIWKIEVSTKFAFFVRTTAHCKLSSMDNHQKRKIIIVDLCCTSKMDAETINHLLLFVDKARDLWSMVFSLFLISWVNTFSVKDLLSC